MEQESEKNTSLILIDQNNYSGTDSTETTLITNAKALKLFYSKVNRTRKPGLPIPKVDFSKELVVIYCASAKDMDNHKILAVLNESEKDIIIGLKRATKKIKEALKTELTVLTNPFYVYKIPLSGKKVLIERLK